MMRRLLAWFLISALLVPVAAVFGKRPDFRPRPCLPSKRSLLSSARSADIRPEAGTRAAGFGLRKDAAPVGGRKPDTLKVLGLMVQFASDSDIETTGNGRFMLEPVAGTTIDPPPHDLAYFQNQLRALTHYWGTVSGGRLTLECEVAPDVFTVVDSLASYVPAESSRSDEAVTAGTVRFFRDAVRQADAAGVRFSDFDCLIVFHAGVGGDLAFDYDPTPRDMPSMFLNLEDLKEHLPASEFNDTGLSVQNGSHGVMEGIVLPETQSQEGYEIGLLGTAALMFGFQLGLPALWNTETGRSGIGAWGLMDQGSGNYNGLIPARPSAIERLLLGWDFPYPAGDIPRFRVACPAIEDSSPMGTVHIVWVDINANEDFLIENRQHDPDGDGVALGLDANGGTVTLGADYQVHFTGNPSVIVSVDEYDYGLPGSGLLIWHIDGPALQAGIVNNTVNADPSRRGVDLEEADGSQDIGESYGMFDAGYGSENGVLQDAWYAGNDVHLLVNGIESVAFTPSSHPNTRSNQGSDSHLSFFDFSESGSWMSFSVRNGRLHPLFPVTYSADELPFSPISCNFNGLSYRDIVMVTHEGGLYTWDTRFDYAFSRSGKTKEGTDLTPGRGMSVGGRFGDAGATVSVMPVCGDLNGDGMDELILLSDDGRIQIWGCPEMDRMERMREISMGEERGTAMILAKVRTSDSYRLSPVIGTESGKVLFLSADGSSLQALNVFAGWVTSLAQWGNDGAVLAVSNLGAAALIAGDTVTLVRSPEEDDPVTSPPITVPFGDPPSVQGIIVSRSAFHFFDALGEAEKWSRPDSDASFTSLAAADINDDGAADIVSVSGGRIWCMNRNGSLMEGFPVRIAKREEVCSDPVIGDVDGDGRPDIIVSTSGGRIAAVDAHGHEIAGFPLPLYGERPLSPSIDDLDGDGRVELLCASDAGKLAVWDMDGSAESLSGAWPMARHDAAGTGRSGFVPGPVGPAPSGGLLPGRTAYNYPNPAYDDFTVIRYRLREASRVRISIHSLAGAEIASFEGPGDGPGDHEAVWSLKGVDSGVYTCRIHASASGESRSAFFKIAVVK